MHTRIVPECIKVIKKFPKLRLQFDINDHDNLTQSLRRGDSQLAIIDQHSLSDEMEYKKLSPELYVLVATPKWKNRRLQEIIKHEKIIDFDEQDQITFDYLKKFELFEFANKDRHFANRTSLLPMMITAGLGYSVLPLEFAKPFIANHQLIVLNAGKTYPQPHVLAWFPRHQQPKYFSALIEACK